jgi:hypothetical protein
MHRDAGETGQMWRKPFLVKQVTVISQMTVTLASPAALPQTGQERCIGGQVEEDE